MTESTDYQPLVSLPAHPNANCKCAGPGLCERHGVTKGLLEFRFCAGIGCTPHQCQKHWNAWEQGRKRGQSGPVENMLPVGIPETRGKEVSSSSVPDCMYRGAQVDSVGCGGCGGGVKLKVFACQIHGKCCIDKTVEGIESCVRTCHSRKPREQRSGIVWHGYAADLPPILPIELSTARRHLMFHLWPVASNSVWKWHCDQLLKHAELFNGRRVVAIAESHDSERAATVQTYLKDFTDQFIIVQNDPKLREVLTWLPMWRKLRKYDSDRDVTFCGQGKCVRLNVDPETSEAPTIKWTRAMYETCFAWDRVQPILEQHACAGSFRRRGVGAPGTWGPWHYSGTFFWMRNRDVFARKWEYVPQRFYGTEAWPGIMFRPEEAGVIACENVNDLYKAEYWHSRIDAQLAEWRRKDTSA